MSDRVIQSDRDSQADVEKPYIYFLLGALISNSLRYSVVQLNLLFISRIPLRDLFCNMAAWVASKSAYQKIRASTKEQPKFQEIPSWAAYCWIQQAWNVCSIQTEATFQAHFAMAGGSFVWPDLSLSKKLTRLAGLSDERATSYLVGVPKRNMSNQVGEKLASRSKIISKGVTSVLCD